MAAAVVPFERPAPRPTAPPQTFITLPAVLVDAYENTITTLEATIAALKASAGTERELAETLKAQLEAERHARATLMNILEAVAQLSPPGSAGHGASVLALAVLARHETETER